MVITISSEEDEMFKTLTHYARSTGEATNKTGYVSYKALVFGGLKSDEISDKTKYWFDLISESLNQNFKNLTSDNFRKINLEKAPEDFTLFNDTESPSARVDLMSLIADKLNKEIERLDTSELTQFPKNINVRAVINTSNHSCFVDIVLIINSLNDRRILYSGNAVIRFTRYENLYEKIWDDVINPKDWEKLMSTETNISNS